MNGLVVLDQLPPHLAMGIGHGEGSRYAASIGEEDTLVVLALDAGIGHANPTMNSTNVWAVGRCCLAACFAGGRARSEVLRIATAHDLPNLPVLKSRFGVLHPLQP